MPTTRISITIPETLVAQADREAKRARRSRSWLIAEAVRRYLASLHGTPAADLATPPAVANTAHEAMPMSYVAGLGGQRLAQLLADLKLSPEQRVREAERTERAADIVGKRRAYGRVSRVVVFDRYEDYVDWKRHGDPQ